MISMTPWGYEADMENAPIIEPQELTARTGASGDRAASMIEAVSAAVRDFCRWHVMPTLECKYTTDGAGHAILLPAKYVSSVSSVKVDGEELPANQWRLMNGGRGGIVETRARLTSWQTVTVEYVAGYENAEMLKQAVANATASALVTPNGVIEEHAGDVGITYANAGDASFVPSDRLLHMLARYRVERGI